MTKNKEFKRPEVKFSTILLNGNHRFDFSETMVVIEEQWPGSKNLTYVNENKNQILEIYYHHIDIDNGINKNYTKPQIQDWHFTELNQFYFDLRINFSSPLYVSIGLKRDSLQLKILHSQPFKSLRSGNHIAKNFTSEPYNIPK